MGVAPTVAPEPGHARPATTRPDGAGARRAPAAPARAAAARPGLLGPGRGAGAERLPGGGARRPPALGAWMGPILHLLRRLRPAVPPGWTVLVLADRGLWSPRLWQRVRDLGWHPLLRIQRRTTITPDGRERCPAGALVRPGEAWVGRGRLGWPKGRRLTVTLVAAWTTAQEEPWVVVTDLPPDRVGVGWYALRAWVELGFRALKGVGWQWQRSRRTDPARVARHWLVLAVDSRRALAHGSRVGDARERGLPPARLRAPPAPPAAARPRRISLFRLGLQWLRHLLARGRLWRRLWLAPEPWPQPPPGLAIASPSEGV